jgi:molybdopterin molybdotransferase
MATVYMTARQNDTSPCWAVGGLAKAFDLQESSLCRNARYDVIMVKTVGFKQLPDYQAALGRVLSSLTDLGVESVPLEQSLGRVLRQAVSADRDQPPFNRSAMDGFAVRSSEVAAEAGRTHPIVATLAAGSQLPDSADLSHGVVRIATGAAVPEGTGGAGRTGEAGGFDAVIPIEQADVTDQQVRFDVTSIKPGQNIHRRGSDASAGAVVIAAGTRLSPHHIGIAAAVGATTLAVSGQPIITLLSSGNEVQPTATPTAHLQPQQIRNSNAPMVCALLESLGIATLEHVHVDDDPELLLATAREALRRSNLVLTTGGVSVGHRDFLPDIWRQLGLEQIIHGVAIQPGKPVLVCQPPNVNKKLVIGLPGNPVSVLVTAHLFVWPVLRRMQGLEAALPWQQVTLSEPIKASPKREVFRACRWSDDKRRQVQVITWHGSGDLAHTAAAIGLVRLPQQDGPVEPGTPVDFLPLAGSY